jgi:hypothetical protein
MPRSQQRLPCVGRTALCPAPTTAATGVPSSFGSDPLVQGRIEELAFGKTTCKRDKDHQASAA